MKVFPLEVITIEQAIEAQFQLVDQIHRFFPNDEFFQVGDLGLAPPHQFPRATEKVEQVLAAYFGAESALLVRGAGTGAMRSFLMEQLKPADSILVHQAPIYPTTETILTGMGLQPVALDYNRLLTQQQTNSALKSVFIDKGIDVKVALIQHSRQQPEDRYRMEETVAVLKRQKTDLVIVADDNYVVFKVPKIGCQLGADVSVFSIFKLFGPPGIGCLVGKREILNRIRQKMYSGGSKVQGYEAMESLRSMVHAPVAFAIQAKVADQIVAELNQSEPEVHKAMIVNAQSRVILVQFKRPIAKKVLIESCKLGASSYPIGSESRYEIPALFYRVSGTFKKADPKMEETTIRINPMRAGKETVLRILRTAIQKAIQ